MQDENENGQGAMDSGSTAASTDPGLEPTRRSTEREVVSYLGIVMLEDHQLTQVDLVDLSAQGARLVASDDFEPKGQFVLKVPETGAGFVSEVVWQNDKTYGIRFLRPSGD